MTACRHMVEPTLSLQMGWLCGACGEQLGSFDEGVFAMVMDQDRRAVWAAFVWVSALVRELARIDCVWALDAEPIEA